MAPFIITLFMFIFISNEIGMLPQVGVHWTSPTNDVNTCFALSLTVALGAHIVGMCQKGISHYKHYISPSPAFLPLHLLDEVVKPLTMSLRLFGNILAGEILLIVLYQLAPWIMPEFWVMFSLFIGFLQAFIFTMLALTSFALAFAHH
jgi:F-type H+-transporting ATPase subunit a